MQYAGYGNQGQVYIYNSAPTLSNCIFLNSSNYDLYYYGTVGGTVSSCTLNSGIYLMATSTVNFTGNTFNQNNSYPIKTYADHVGSVVFGNTFDNLDASSYLEVSSDTIEHDATWTAAIPYKITGNVTIKGTDGADAVTTLTIEPGAKLLFNSNLQLNVGAASGDPGALKAQGTSAELILFTSSQSTPAPGNWRGIKFYNTTDDDISELRYCIVEYAGYGNQGLVYLYNAKPSIAYSTFRDSSHAGVYAYGTGSNDTEITCNTFANNNYGVYASNALPLIHQNNFIGNTSYGVYNGSTQTLNAENNWWNIAAGPNAGGDATYGNVDADPWSTQENQCVSGGENTAPNTPTSPTPQDNSVRVSITSGVTLTWTGGDPDPLDSVTYDLYRGTTADALTLNSQALPGSQHQWNDLNQGITYHWQVVAKDSAGAESTGPVWRFTTDGGPPDLSINSLSLNPSGNLQAGQSATFTATIQNSGGPVVEAFVIDLLIDGASIGTHQVDPIVYGGDTFQQTWSWTYTGGDPAIEVKVDSTSQVTEDNETNNSLNTTFLSVADNAAPDLVGTSPSGGAVLQQVQQITATLADTQSAVDDAAVIESFAVTDTAQQSIPGNTTEANDTFTFVPSTLPMADSNYMVSLTATDTHGNTQAHTFSFTIDTQPPAKPVITGGTVSSGTIQARPAQNTADEFRATLTGTREAGTSVWLNGVRIADIGDDAWSTQLLLSPGANSFEVWLVDRASNRGESAWVDLDVPAGSPITYEYDTAGRIKRVNNLSD